MTFYIYDDRGNGLSEPGGYSVVVSGVEVKRGGDFGYTESTVLAPYSSSLSCSNDTIHFQLNLTTDQFSQRTTWAVLGGSGDTKLSGGSYDRRYTYIVEECLSLSSNGLTFYIFDLGGDGLSDPADTLFSLMVMKLGKAKNSILLNH